MTRRWTLLQACNRMWSVPSNVVGCRMHVFRIAQEAAVKPPKE